MNYDQKGMKVIVFLIFIFICPGHGLDCECGLEQVSRRISGGRKVEYRQYPWIASILSPLPTQSFGLCTGSLINDRFILTSASCFNDPQTIDVTKIVVSLNVNSKSEYESMINDNNRPAGNAIKVLIDKLIVHPNYRSLKENNIALLRLKTPVAIDSTLNPICLASFSTNSNLFVLGFGQTNLSNRKISDHLEEATISPITHSHCDEIYRNKVDTSEDLSDSILCGNGDPGILSGDFGGPLSTRVDGQVYQIGISSHYFHDHEEFNKDIKLFDAFERISSHILWIESETKDARWCGGKFQAVSSKRTSNSVKSVSDPPSVPAPLTVVTKPSLPIRPLPLPIFHRQPLTFLPTFRPIPVPVAFPFFRFQVPLIPRQPPSPGLKIQNDQCECGLETSTLRIINGRPVKVNQYPWMASILIPRAGTSHGMCGGSLINDNFILTAAHCLYSQPDVSEMIVTLGSHTMDDRFDRPNLEVESIHIHPQYNPHGEVNDIALIKLRYSLTFNGTVRPICIPLFASQDNLFVTGWGLSSNGLDSTSGVVHLQEENVLQEAEISVVDMNNCQVHYANVDRIKDICAGGEAGGTCLGDSGGPLSTRIDGLVYQVGITSFGAVDCGVISKSPNVFERTTAHLNWIGEVTNPSKWCYGKYQAITNN